MTLDAREHRVESRFTASEPDPLHRLSHEVRRNAKGRLRGMTVDRRKENREEGGDRRRLSRVEIGVEVEIAIADLRKEIHTRLALGHGELGAVEREKSVGHRLELL